MQWWAWIVLGAALMFWLLGIPRSQTPPRWQRRAVQILALTAIVLAIPLTTFLLPVPNHPLLPVVAPGLIVELRRSVEDSSGTRLINVERRSETDAILLDITVEAESEPEPFLADRLAGVAARRLLQPIRVRLSTRLVSSGSSNQSLPTAIPLPWFEPRPAQIDDDAAVTQAP